MKNRSLHAARASDPTLISDYFEFHRLAVYVATHTKRRAAFVIGAGTLAEIFDESMYTGLQGGTREALGRLFQGGLTLYVYPLLDPATGKLTTEQNFEVNPRLRGLYDYLVATGSIRQLENYTPGYLPIFSRDVLAKISRGDPGWEAMVPPGSRPTIRERRAFGGRAGHDRSAA